MTFHWSAAWLLRCLVCVHCEGQRWTPLWISLIMDHLSSDVCNVYVVYSIQTVPLLCIPAQFDCFCMSFVGSNVQRMLKQQCDYALDFAHNDSPDFWRLEEDSVDVRSDCKHTQTMPWHCGTVWLFLYVLCQQQRTTVMRMHVIMPFCEHITEMFYFRL